MTDIEEPPQGFRWQATADEAAARFWRRLEIVALLSGVTTTAIRHGLIRSSQSESVGLGVLVLLAASVVALAYAARYRLSLRKFSFARETWSMLGFSILWAAGLAGILVFAPLLPALESYLPPRIAWLVLLGEWLVSVLTAIQIAGITRGLATRGLNPALLLAGTFAALIVVGTLLLMLPRARAAYVAGDVAEGAPFLTALFTATSASCVTGLVVENTGEYWSRFGQTIILLLFQLGGLGIMTSGAVFVALAGRSLQVGETATLRQLLGSEKMSDVRRLLVTILVFTLCAELIGAILISGLWADLPFWERAFQSLFHSISAFCNAGFSLTPDSFVGMGGRWQVAVVVCALIITGGLGFGVIHNLFRVLRLRLKQSTSAAAVPVAERRLSLTSRMVLTATFSLLVGGTLTIYLLESLAPADGESLSLGWADAWFQSVTLRTAGFNTVDLGELQTTSKLFSIALMFVGASPGSTGGGIKTVCLSLVVLSVVSLLRGRERVELGHRWIPEQLVQRAFLIVALGVTIVMTSTFLLVLFENQPEKFIDHLFEATSAFATVGVSTGVTPELTSPSRVVIFLAMYIGRIGPLTLMLALASRADRARYDLPEERVALG